MGWTVPWRTLMEKLCCLIALVLQQLSGTSITNYYYHQTLWLRYLSWLYTCPKSSRFELKTCLLLTFQRCLNQREGMKCTLTGPAEDSVLFNNFFLITQWPCLLRLGPGVSHLTSLPLLFVGHLFSQSQSSVGLLTVIPQAHIHANKASYTVIMSGFISIKLCHCYHNATESTDRLETSVCNAFMRRWETDIFLGSEQLLKSISFKICQDKRITNLGHDIISSV